jgi:hypothetical protein
MIADCNFGPFGVQRPPKPSLTCVALAKQVAQEGYHNQIKKNKRSNPTSCFFYDILKTSSDEEKRIGDFLRFWVVTF